MKAILLSVLLLCGCSTVVPVTQRFPEAPGMLATQSCAPLQKLESDPKLSQVAKTVTHNYDEYWMCALKVEAWREWYQKQKAVFEELNK